MRVLYLLLLILCSFFALNVAIAGVEVYIKSKKVDLLRKDIIELENQKESLGAEYAYRQSREYVELVARRDLLMAYPEEKPTEILLKANASDPKISQEQEAGKVTPLPTPIYQMWLKVFGISF
ncbi:hypothetical protein L6255_03160 [Candidatus Parcubacteria bacterium]|nr:hypothetical protein [Patescibacteria group bacterium]MBU4381189.1 hypothetical protein [Patescibacteria group bacterium]MCG2689411.1 hypothetical protein [Candidatus Parcubacteria bacterium]